MLYYLIAGLFQLPQIIIQMHYYSIIIYAKKNCMSWGGEVEGKDPFPVHIIEWITGLSYYSMAYPSHYTPPYPLLVNIYYISIIFSFNVFYGIYSTIILTVCLTGTVSRWFPMRYTRAPSAGWSLPCIVNAGINLQMALAYTIEFLYYRSAMSTSR